MFKIPFLNFISPQKNYFFKLGCPSKVNRPVPKQPNFMPDAKFDEDDLLKTKEKQKRIKGLKLDFKHWNAVEPTLRELAQAGVSADLPHVREIQFKKRNFNSY